MLQLEHPGRWPLSTEHRQWRRGRSATLLLWKPLLKTLLDRSGLAWGFFCGGLGNRSVSLPVSVCQSLASVPFDPPYPLIFQAPQELWSMWIRTVHGPEFGTWAFRKSTGQKHAHRASHNLASFFLPLLLRWKWREWGDTVQTHQRIHSTTEQLSSDTLSQSDTIFLSEWLAYNLQRRRE